MGANSVDEDHTATTGAAWSGSALYVKEASKHTNRPGERTTFVVIDALRVNSSYLLSW